MAGSMKNTHATTITFLILAAALFVQGYCPAQAVSQEAWEKPVDAATVVRFFYLPADSYAHPPLIFRVAPQGDRRLGTAPIVNMGGRTPFISTEEMQKLIQGLTRTGLAWEQSGSPKPVSPVPNREKADRMEISIFFTDHPVQAQIPASQLCQTLSELDKAFVQPRALWEFQLYRVDYGCSVQNFNRSAFPQHDDPKLDKQ